MNIWKKRSVIKLDILGEKDEYLSIIKRRSNGLYKLVEVFYDLSKLEANEYKFNMEKIDINKEVREHILLFYNDFENKNINVEINLLNEEVFVEADKTASLIYFKTQLSTLGENLKFLWKKQNIMSKLF